MSYQIKDVVPVTLNQFDAVAAIHANDQEAVVRNMREAILLSKATLSILPQMMLYNFSFDVKDVETPGVFAPQHILGPRRRIDVADITPGMANVGYTKPLEGSVNIRIFNDVITKVEPCDGKVHVYSNEEWVRDSPDKQWFIQHVWAYSEVCKIEVPGGEDVFCFQSGDADKDDYLLSINLNPLNPDMRMVRFNDTARVSLINAYEGTSAMYYLTPKLVLPRLSGDAIPPMPGAVPVPAPSVPDDAAEAAEAGPSIPPMPGGAEEEWVKPKTADWWIS